MDTPTPTTTINHDLTLARTTSPNSLSPSAPTSHSHHNRISSLFHRSNNSETPKFTAQRAPFAEMQSPELARPQTSTGMYATPRRRRTEALDSIRNSIFGGRKKSNSIAHETRPETLVRPSSRSSSRALSRPTTSQVATNSEDEFYRHLKKTTISPPFNFHHVSHAAKKSLPSLDTVDEKELQQHFQSLSSSSFADTELQDIDASTLQERQRLEEKCQHRSNISVDETTFDESTDTRFDPSDYLAESPSSRSLSVPRRCSSMNALNRPNQWSPPIPESQEVDSEAEIVDSPVLKPTLTSDSETSQADPPSSSDSDVSTIREGHSAEPEFMTVLDDVPEDFEAFSLPQPSQSLPLLPDQTKPDASSQLSVISYASSEGRQSTKSFRSSHSAQKSPATSSVGDVRNPSVISGLSWEDEIDFMYEQEAEASCNFDWRNVTPITDASSCSADSQGQLSDMVSSYPAPLVYVPRSHPKQPSIDCTRPTVESHRRGSSVGHRGFQLARRMSTENPPRPATMIFKLNTADIPNHDSPLSPVLSSNGKEDRAAVTTEEFVFPALGVSSAGYLSDPEAVRPGRSKHRKSSSYSSYGSSSRYSQGSSKQSSRWSIASSACVPELMHSSQRSRGSLQKSVISQPLETLPQSPDGLAPAVPSKEKSLPPLPPYNAPPLPPKETFRVEDVLTRPGLIMEEDESGADGGSEMTDDEPVMRRPRSAGERAALQAAGSAVRQSRPSRPSIPRRPSPPSPADRLVLLQLRAGAQANIPEGWF